METIISGLEKVGMIGDLILDPVADTAPGAIEIGFDRSAHANCSDILWQNLSRNPDRAAVIGPQGTLTYRDLVAEAGRWGNAFIAAGLMRGERIAFFLDDSPSFPAAFFGAVRAGFVPVLLNIQTKSDVLNYFLKDSSARFAVVDADLTESFTGETLDGAALQTIVVTNGPTTGAMHIQAQDFLAGHDTVQPCADTGPDDMAFWMYSSGSTGRPKGIVHLHHDMAYVQASFGAQILKLTADDIAYSVPKMYFAYGFGNSIIFPFSVGATALLVPGQPRPDVVLDAVEAFRPTVLFGLPTLYTALAKSQGIGQRDLSSLRQSMSAAEILSEDVYNLWKAKVGHGPTEGLGSTEMLHIYLSNRLDDHRLGAAGARVPGYEIRLETPEGNPPAPGQEGVMFVRGHSSAPCYWNRPDKTTESMRGDWLYTGDRFIEKDGFYYFQGRADDLIKVSGQWVWPLEVERCLNEHPDVHECAVLAHQLADKRMALRAVVALVKGVDASDARTASLRDYVKEVLTPFKSPRIFEYCDELPKTGTGKIDRQALINAPANQTDKMKKEPALTYVLPLPPTASVAVAGSNDRFPVRRIFCVGRNYAAHAREMGKDPDRDPPFFFTKPADAVVDSGETVAYPPQTDNFHYEAELVVAIGTGGRDVSEEDSLSHVWGYAVGNDLTRRDLQLLAREQGRPWDWGKAFDRSAVIGPVHPHAAVGHLETGRIRLLVNGTVKQDADLADLIWSVPEIISILSHSIALAPGDLIMTGTPAGVGALVPGDVCVVEIEGIGQIETPIGPKL